KHGKQPAGRDGGPDCRPAARRPARTLEGRRNLAWDRQPGTDDWDQTPGESDLARESRGVKSKRQTELAPIGFRSVRGERELALLLEGGSATPARDARLGLSRRAGHLAAARAHPVDGANHQLAGTHTDSLRRARFVGRLDSVRPGYACV